ncbi:lysine--tRNA ligase [Desertibaculum subflavum]|uniref:lysine--tRNA ligase n=1 Tax=Desertibaculum subflavum TaxID=2268458 RepID=UPI000E6611F4
MNHDRDLLLASNAWPFQEAEKLVQRFAKAPPAKGYVLFETGYGPSGLPHLGTFGEVARTSMVRRAFRELSDLPARLFAFSDDLDGLRKVPDNVPNQAMLREHLGKPLTKVPDPFGTHESFGHHNNARLCAFLDRFGFEYEFQSATDWYSSGRFDAALLSVLQHYEKVMAVMLPSLRAERAATYSPFLPICAKTGRVLQAPVIATDAAKGTITYRDDDGDEIEVPVTGGHCKLQWKCDWAMRWAALGVDYEMSGKDLIDSVKLSSQIARILDATPPEGFTYELFLDEKGEKISKSKGNGLTIDEWLTYAAPESLALYMFQKPRQAKRLYFDVIPRAVDDYLTFLDKFHGQNGPERFANPVWHIHGEGHVPREQVPVTFSMLLNLASVCNAEAPEILWGFIRRYAPGATPQANPILDRMIGYAIAYYRDFVKPQKRYRAPGATERAALSDLLAMLEQIGGGADAEALQNEVYEIGKRHGFANLRDWFKALYEVLLGQETGPRMGSFIALYGVEETKGLIRKVLAGESLAA